MVIMVCCISQRLLNIDLCLTADMDLTMLKRLCEKQRLTTRLEDSAEFRVLDSRGDSLAGILLGNDRLLDTRDDQNTRVSEKARRSQSIRLPNDEYNAILLYLNQMGQYHQHRDDTEYTSGGLVLSSYATAVKRFGQHGRTFGTHHVHEGNSLVWARRLGVSGMGFIGSIWELEVAGKERIFFILEDLDLVPKEQDPFRPWPGLECCVAYDRPTERQLVFEPEHLISHLCGRRRPSGTFGLSEAVLTLCNMNQGKVPQ